ncbi:MAG: ABC transporter substrate-binding protein [Xanthobacteraceae bacterium]
MLSAPAAVHVDPTRASADATRIIRFIFDLPAAIAGSAPVFCGRSPASEHRRTGHPHHAPGGPPGTFTAVMSGQIDIGWSAPPFGLQEERDGKIRIIARGSDAKSLDGQTVRALVVNANALKDRKDAIVRFVRAYRESVDWMYSNPDAIKRYAEKTRLPEALIKSSIEKFHPKSALQTDAIKDVEGIMRDAVKLKFLDKPLTEQQLAEFVQIPPR